MTAGTELSTELDFGPLSRLFADTTNSYKIIFFQALLALLAEQSTITSSNELTLRAICIEMVVLSWYPRAYFKLSFGLQDKLAGIIDSLQYDGGRNKVGTRGHTDALRAAVADQYDHLGLDRLLRYVPYRLLQPFYRLQLQGLPEHARSLAIARLADESFHTGVPPLYRVIEGNRIEVHPRWAEYLRNSLPIVTGWCRNHWIEFLQRRNPGIPAIPAKASPPALRGALTRQTNYWRLVERTSDLNCFYTQTPLTATSMALDHFVPWSFVCCDQLWNLVPALPSVNSAKSNQLPHPRYLQDLATVQSAALRVSRTHMSQADWLKATESFVADLKLEPGDLLDEVCVRDAYNRAIPALIALASMNGFREGWQLSA